MKLLLFTLFFSSSIAAADGVNLSAQSFQIHVRPQLVNIQEDIKQILLTFPGYPAEVFTLQGLSDQLSSVTSEAQKLCSSRLQKSCLPQLNRAVILLRDMNRLWLAQEAKTNFPQSASLAPLVGKKSWNAINSAAGKLQLRLEAEALALQANRTSERMSIWEWRRRVSEIEDWQNLMVIDFIPGKLQDDFRQAWMNFFRPLYKQCVLGNNRAYLAKNLHSLNFYWNLLNMRLTKRLKKTPEGMSGPLNAIQNRWNQVLRVAFAK